MAAVYNSKWHTDRH